MPSNYWEDQKMSSEIKDWHESEMNKIGCPDWFRNISCPKCSSILPLRSIRSFGVKFNARNIGDICVEFCCDQCMIMDTLYFKSEIKNLSEIKDLLSEIRAPEGKPIVESEMYKMMYNNLFELHFKESNDPI